VRHRRHTGQHGQRRDQRSLSVNRASSTRSYLASRGVDASRVAIDGRGSRDRRPTTPPKPGADRTGGVEIVVAGGAGLIRQRDGRAAPVRPGRHRHRDYRACASSFSVNA